MLLSSKKERPVVRDIYGKTFCRKRHVHYDNQNESVGNDTRFIAAGDFMGWNKYALGRAIQH